MKTLRIMYVEDNTELRDAPAGILAGPGREVAALATAEEALVAWESNAPDLLVTDMGLPGLSGIDLTRIVVARKPAQWVALCSGYEHGSQAVKQSSSQAVKQSSSARTCALCPSRSSLNNWTR
jgi:two-component system cell cycle response regulator CpdR